MSYFSYNSADKKDDFTQPVHARAGVTTTSEEQSEHSYSFFPSAVGAKAASVNKVAAFTLVEAVIAVSILLLVISGIMNVIHQGSSTTRYQKDRTTATYLAADTIEFVRDKRDSHWLASESEENPNTFQSWATSSFPAECDGGTWCQVDTRQSVEAVTVCGSSADDCDLLDYNTDTGLYGYDTGINWQESDFTRSFTIEPDDLDPESAGPETIKITSEVTWPRVSGDISSVSFSEHLYGWRYATGFGPPPNPIIAGLQDAMSAAQSYHSANGDSYEDLCFDPDIQQAVNNLDSVSDGVVCWEASNPQGSDVEGSAYSLALIDYGIGVKLDDVYYAASPFGVGTFDTENIITTITTWSSAQTACSNAGKRLPSPSALRAIWGVGNDSNTDTTPTGFTPNAHWSAVEVPADSSQVYRPFMHDGYMDYSPKTWNAVARCIQ